MKGGKAVKQIKRYGAIVMVIGMLTVITACGNEKSEYEKFKEDLDDVGEEIFNKVFEDEDEE